MRLPAEVRARLDTLLEERGSGRVLSIEPVGGGCISETGRLRTSDARDFFLKWTTADALPGGLFDAEAEALEVIDRTGTVRVPAVFGVRDRTEDSPETGGRWLLLEWLEPGAPTPATWNALGYALADLHRTGGPAFGWPSDNFIGTLPQTNAAMPDWPSFWRERRLLPQLHRATAAGILDTGVRSRFDRLLHRLDDILAPAAQDGPSLLHGDLWSGNLHVLDSGTPALVDPSSYYGHREVDLAMTALFGGFDRRFLEAYHEAWPLLDDFEPRRRATYQLYYLLVHLNLFGTAYLGRTLDALDATGV